MAISCGELELTFSWRDSFCDGHPKEWNSRSNLDGAESTCRMRRKEPGKLRIGPHKGRTEDILFAPLRFV